MRNSRVLKKNISAAHSSRHPVPAFRLSRRATTIIRCDRGAGTGIHPAQLNFWATWCPPCREEKPTMEQLYQQKKDDGLVILAINVEENPHQVVSQYLLQHSYSFPILLDGIKAEVQGLYGVFRYPESFIIDRDGAVVEHIIGGRDWMENPTYRLIESLLNN